LDLNTPELTRIFREELQQRSDRLVSGARALRDRTLAAADVPDLIRDAHTIKGSSGLLGHDRIREAATCLEQLWRGVLEGKAPEGDVVVAMEAAAGRLPSAVDDESDELPKLIRRLAEGLKVGVSSEVLTLPGPEAGSLGGLLSSVSESLLGGVTRVDTGDLYRLINRVVEVSLDADALADLSLVSIEGADPDMFRKAWRVQLEKLSSSISEIQDQAVSLADVSFAEVTSTFHQFVRYLGRRIGKDVRLELIGEPIHIDRQIVDLLREPLRHLLVNAVDHGLEDADHRVSLGKAATGTITVGIRSVDGKVEISVADDGGGIDWSLVARTAEEQDMAPLPTVLTPLLFHPGFSTVDPPTEFSGSGEGLTSVREAVELVRGVIRIESQRDKGTTVVMTLPVSMVLQDAVIVATGDQFWGLPEASVEASMSLSKAEIHTTPSGRTIRFASGDVPYVSLAEAVGHEGDTDEQEIVIVNTRFGLIAVSVDELVDRRRVAVKNLGPILEGPGHVTGAALLGAGQILVVLDPNYLGMFAGRRPRPIDGKPRVLVVDDSAGVRQLLSATLNGAGFEVTVAGGAREAVMAMAEEEFDALVVDYSMPRSSGTDLVRALRGADVDVPIVMVSGVATPEEKQEAWRVGVDAYLDKFDLRQGVLSSTIRRLIGVDEAADTTAS
jgi:chemotaxis protein histidine kinase CheA/methylmalonyl-CoA mutase cobalamin-binding subunit